MRLKYLVYLFMSVLLISCGGPKLVSNNAAPGIDIGKYRTFDFYKLDASGDTIPGKFRERSALLQDAIASQLSSRGFTRSSEKPDLLVNIGLVVKEEVQTRTTDIRDAPRYMGQRNYHWESEEIEVDRYRVGTATIDLVEAASNALIWTAAVEDVIPEKDDKVAAAINKGVAEMFSKFPAKK